MGHKTLRLSIPRLWYPHITYFIIGDRFQQGTGARPCAKPQSTF